MTLRSELPGTGRRRGESPRVQMLLDVRHGFSRYVVYILRRTPGVTDACEVMAKAAGGRTAVLLTIEALNQEIISDIAAHALASVERAVLAVHPVPAHITVMADDPAGPG